MNPSSLYYARRQVIYQLVMRRLSAMTPDEQLTELIERNMEEFESLGMTDEQMLVELYPLPKENAK